MSTAKAYHGSCHCGDVQYQIKLTFPPVHDFEAQSIRLYKCNCSTCHKMGMFHCRPISPGDNFILTSPSTIEELGDYRAFSGKIGWYFCKKCGVRVFGFGGQWEQTDVDVGKWAGKEEDGKTQKVWVTKAGGEITGMQNGKESTRPLHYLSVNAVTLENGEDGVDLREWHEKGWIFYVENRESKNGTQMRVSEPYPQGCH